MLQTALAAKQISVDAVVATLLSEQDSICTLNKEQGIALKYFLGGKMFFIYFQLALEGSTGKKK